MTVNMKRAVRRQTINHFMYTFMKDYATEKAADQTMKSKYVPRNLKTQLVSAMARCEESDRPQIERVAGLGMFIDSSCNELIYYNTITTAVVRWTVSLYVESCDVKRLFDVVMEDAGRICEDDIQFIMERYRYLEARGALGGGDGCGESGGGLMGFLRPRKCGPETSLIRYYGQTLWMKILKAVMRNSTTVFNANSFSTVFSGIAHNDYGEAGTADVLDEESRTLYNQFRDNRTEWFKAAAVQNEKKVENAVAADFDDRSTSGSDDETAGERRTGKAASASGRKRRQPPRLPPYVTSTVFDVQFDDDYSDEEQEGEEDGQQDDATTTVESVDSESDISEAETVLEAPYTYRNRSSAKGGGRVRNESLRDGSDDENNDAAAAAAAAACGRNHNSLQTYVPKSATSEEGSCGNSTLRVFGVADGVTAVTGAGATLVTATLTQQKRLRVLDKELRNVLLEERTSKALATQRNDGNGGDETVTRVETTYTKRKFDGTLQQQNTLSAPAVSPRASIRDNTFVSYRTGRDPLTTRSSGLKALSRLPDPRSFVSSMPQNANDGPLSFSGEEAEIGLARAAGGGKNNAVEYKSDDASPVVWYETPYDAERSPFAF